MMQLPLISVNVKFLAPHVFVRDAGESVRFQMSGWFVLLLVDDQHYEERLKTNRSSTKLWQHSQHISTGHWVAQGQPGDAHGAFLIWLEGYLRSEHIRDREVWMALWRECLPYTHPRLFLIASKGRHMIRALGPRHLTHRVLRCMRRIPHVVR
jgi:hypothetical protein